MGFSLERFTAAEIFQMYTERMRQDWQHTAFLAAYMIETTRGKKGGKKIRPDDLNPMESGSKQVTKGIKLDSPEGFAQLAQVAQWQPR